MPVQNTKITRACEHAGVVYKVGQVVRDPHTAEHLVRLGFASTSDPEVKSALKIDAAHNNPEGE